MLDAFWQALSAQMQNQVVTGGLALGAVGDAAALAARLPSVVRFLVESQFITTITIDSRSGLFDGVGAWLADHPYTRSCRRLVAVRDRQRELDRVSFLPAHGNHFLRLGRTLVWISRTMEAARPAGAGSAALPLETITIRALTRDVEFLRHLIVDVHRRYGGRDPERIVVHVAGSYGEWEEQASVRRRPYGTVVLTQGMAEHLLEDAREFLASADWYAERGIPWRRGYLLHGPPGTGKTSIVKALAGELGLDLAMVNLASDRLDDVGLCALMASAPPRSLLLFEDIDAVFRGREATDAGKGLTFSGLLNAIDGVMAQEGHLLVMTTNHIEQLDPALIRPGRIDWRGEIGLAHGEQIGRLFRAFYPGQDELLPRFVAAFAGREVAPAEIQKLFLEHRNDPAAAVATVEASPAEPGVDSTLRAP